MNRRTFFKVALGTIGVLLLDPIKVLSEKPQQTPKKDLDFKIEKTEVRAPSRQLKSKYACADAKIIDLVRIAYPTMLAHQICSVQPMTEATGQIFKIRYVTRPWYKRMFDRFRPFRPDRFA